MLQIFLLEGRFIFGPDARSLFLTIFLIVAPVSVFCAFVARKLMDDFSHNLGITIMIVAVAFTLYVSANNSFYLIFKWLLIFIEYEEYYVYVEWEERDYANAYSGI